MNRENTGGSKRFLAAALSGILFCGTILSAGGFTGAGKVEAGKIGADELSTEMSDEAYSYIYTSDKGDTHTLNFHARWVDGGGQQAVYCTQRSKHFNVDGEYTESNWEANAMYSQIAYAIYHGCSTYGDTCDSAYTTGDWIEDYYATQIVVWCIREDFGYDGVKVNALSAVPGYEDVYKCAIALYNATKENAGDDGYGDTISLEIDEPDSTVMDLDSSKTYYQTGWYSIETEGTVSSSSVTLSGAPEGAEIVYGEDDQSRFYIRISVDDAEAMTADSDTFSVKAAATFSRPIAYNYYSENDDDQNVTFLQYTVSDSLSASASATLKLEKTSIEIYKTDSETGYGVAGATYGVYSDSACTDLVATLGPTDSDGYAVVKFVKHQDVYYVQETDASELYVVNTEVNKVSVIVTETSTVETEEDSVRGQITLTKTDSDTGSTAQGNASLEGAVYGLYAAEDIKHPDGHTGVLYEEGELVASQETDEDGSLVFENLYLGSYYIQEITPSEGYNLDETKYEVTLSYKDQNTAIITDAETVSEDVIRGGVAIEKKDLESGLSSALGAATLEGADFEIVNLSDEAVLVDGTLYEYGDVVATITTDEDGYASTDSDTLPYGYYVIQEVTAPEGYLLTDDTAYGFYIKEDGVIVTAGEDGEAVYDQVKRGDVDFTKTDEDSQDRLSGVPFLITSETTGESHVLVTDANGYASTSADWNSHTSSTNANDAAVSVDEDGNYIVDESLLDPEAGIWFGLTEEGWTVDADDSLGALPYDTYTITELPCSANEGLTLVEVSLTITRDGYTVEYGTIDDPTPDNTTPSVTTSAANEETGTRYAAADDEVIIIDTVSYDNLEVGETYTVSGVLMDRETGDEFLDADGNTVTGTTTFTATAASGSAEVEYVFDATGMDGAAVVVFESLYSSEGELVAEHKDLTDDYQTVLFSAVDTEAVDYETGVDMSGADDSVTIIDTISYSNLQENRRYRIVGVLMDASTGEALLDANGNEVTAETAIKPESSDGTVELAFTFDGSALAGTDVVVYEYVYRNFNLVASHEDIEDENQTVHFPSVETTAIDSETGIGVSNADDSVTIVDTIAYENVLAGEAYTVKGVLMDASTGEAVLDADGNEVASEAEFTAEETSGTVEVSFTFDGTGLEGCSYVAFENLYWGEYLIASHEDIEDENQTVDFPSVETTALDSETGTHEAMADSEVTLVDTVEYTGLTVGKGYTVSGVLYDQETGEPLEIDGEQVTAETTFTAESSEGSVEISFTFDGSALAGETVVAFETLYYDGNIIAVHADLEDEGQTVYFPGIGTNAADADDGDSEVLADEEAEIIDTVSYSNLTAGETYKVSGILHDKETGEPLEIGGEEVTAETEFTADDISGSVEVRFTFDASGLEGKEIVVFETLRNVNGDTVASHEDLEDEGQTVFVISLPAEESGSPVQTKDRSMAAGWAALIGFAAAACGIAAAVSRRNRRKEMDV